MRYIILLLAGLLPWSATAQSYTVDSTAFNALNLDGGKTELAVSDVDQDGHPDLLTVGDHGSPFINTNQHGVSVFFGNGTGAGWTLFQNGNFGYGGIAVGDVNNDRYQDVAYGIHHDYSSTDFGDQLIEAAIGDGTGTVWTPWDDLLGTAGETYGMMGTDLGDVNNDGWLDIGSGSFGCCAGTHVYLNQTNGTWMHSYGYTGGNTSKYFEFGDLNHDGNLDFACCHQSGAVYFGDGTGNFTPMQANLPTTGNFGFGDISLGDANNNGADDIAFLQSGKPYVYEWHPVQQWVSMSAGLPVTGSYSDLEMADLDMDGHMDLVLVREETLEIWKGNGGSAWSLFQSFTFGNMDDAKDIAIADIDHNGMPDILFWAEYYISWFTYENRLRLIRETSVAASLAVTLQSPGNYACLPSGAVRFIHWVSAVPQNHPSSVKIEFSSGGPSGPWTTVETDVPNNGKYQWDVPAGVSSADCYLRLVVTDSTTLASDTSVNALPFQVGVCNPLLGRDEISEIHVAVYPNPATDFIVVSAPFETFGFGLYDVFGKKILWKEAMTPGRLSFSRESVPPGFYVVEIRPEGKPSAALKLLIE